MREPLYGNGNGKIPALFYFNKPTIQQLSEGIMVAARGTDATLALHIDHSFHGSLRLPPPVV